MPLLIVVLVACVGLLVAATLKRRATTGSLAAPATEPRTTEDP
jgi:hypothetical protein